MERLFFKEKTNSDFNCVTMDSREKIKKTIVGVLPVSQGAGATFIATSLAFLLSKKVEKRRSDSENSFFSRCVCCMEGGMPPKGSKMLFYEVSLDKKLRWGRFTDFFAMSKRGEFIGDRVNYYKGINWVVHGPEGEESLLSLDDLAGELIIIDNPREEYIQRCELIIGVIDPMPAAVFAALSKYEEVNILEKEGKKVIWLLNKDNSKVNHGEIKRFLKLRHYETIPLIDSLLFYECQYNCILPIEGADFPESARDTFNNIISEISSMAYFTI